MCVFFTSALFQYFAVPSILVPGTGKGGVKYFLQSQLIFVSSKRHETLFTSDLEPAHLAFRKQPQHRPDKKKTREHGV